MAAMEHCLSLGKETDATLHASDSGLDVEATATDRSASVRTSVSCDVEDAESIVVNAASLRRALDTLKKSSTLTSWTTDNSLIVANDVATMKLHAQEVGDGSHVRDAVSPIIHVRAGRVATALRRVLHAAPVKGDRPGLRGVHVTLASESDGVLRVTATDGFRLGTHEIHVSLTMDAEIGRLNVLRQGCTIHRTGAACLDSVLRHADTGAWTTISLSSTNDRVSFDVGSSSISTMVLDEKFHRIARGSLRSSDRMRAVLSLPRKTIESASKMLMKNKVQYAVVTSKDGTCGLRGEVESDEESTSVTLGRCDAEAEFKLKLRYLLDAVSCLDAEDVVLNVYDNYVVIGEDDPLTSMQIIAFIKPS